MTDTRTLGPWLRRFLEEHLPTERNLARNTQLSYRDTFCLLLPFVATQARRPVDRLQVRDLGAERVLAFLAHVRARRRGSRLLPADPQPATGRHPGLRPLCRQPQSGARRMVRPGPRHPAQEGPGPLGWLLGAERSRGLARGSRPQHQTGLSGARPAALPLQHGSPGVGSGAADGRGPAAGPRAPRPRVRLPAGQGGQDAPVPVADACGRGARRSGRRTQRQRAGLPEPSRSRTHPLGHAPAGRAMRGASRRARAVAGGQAGQSAYPAPRRPICCVPVWT